MFTIPTTSVTFSSESIDETDKKKVTLILIVPVVTDRIMQTFEALNKLDDLLQGDTSVDTQANTGLGMEITNVLNSNVVTYKFIM